MTAERRQQGFVFTGWHMLGVMVLFFGTIITVNLVMAWNATHSWSGLVVQNTYVASQQFNDAALAQRALGWTAEADYADGVLTVDIRDRDGMAAQVERIEALVGWATSTRDDFRPVLTRDGSRFSAPAEMVPSNWDVYLKAWAPDGTLFQQRLALHVGGVAPPPAPLR